MESSVGRALCIAATTYAMHVTYTAPSTVTAGDAIVGQEGIAERYILKLRQYGMWEFKGFFWVTGAAELVAIAAAKKPLSGLSQLVLPFLWPSGKSLSSLRLNPVSAVGLALIVGGTLIRAYCYRTMKNMFTFDISIKKNHRLVKEGPYSIVRHPSYFGMAMTTIGCFMWYGVRGSWVRESGVLDTAVGKAFFYLQAFNVLFVTSTLLRRMTTEDRNLKKEFGKEWDEWARKVPYVVFPGIF